MLDRAVAEDRAAGDDVAGRLRSCAQREADLGQRLRRVGDRLTTAEVAAQRARDQEQEIVVELDQLPSGWACPPSRPRRRSIPRSPSSCGSGSPSSSAAASSSAPSTRWPSRPTTRRSSTSRPLEAQRTDLETALRELRAFVRDTDRQIQETFEQTFRACAKNFEELSEHVFPGGRGRLRLVREHEDAAEGGRRRADGRGRRRAAARRRPRRGRRRRDRDHPGRQVE